MHRLLPGSPWRLCATRKYTGTVEVVFPTFLGPCAVIAYQGGAPFLDLARENNSLRPPLRKLNVANHAVRITSDDRDQARGPSALSKLEHAVCLDRRQPARLYPDARIPRTGFASGNIQRSCRSLVISKFHLSASFVLSLPVSPFVRLLVVASFHSTRRSFHREIVPPSCRFFVPARKV